MAFSMRGLRPMVMARAARAAARVPRRGATRPSAAPINSVADGERFGGALANIDLVVCDMAGTTVEEAGIVYTTLQKVMNDDGLEEAVIEHFARQHDVDVASEQLEARIKRVSDAFGTELLDAYFAPESPVRTIHPALLDYIRNLQAVGIKVALNTGYPRDIQDALLAKTGLGDVVDASISSYEVPQGRPWPYMVHRLMEQLGVSDVRRVAKCGDTVRDIEEGKQAGCGLVVGVLSGADDAKALTRAGADLVVDVFTSLPVPVQLAVGANGLEPLVERRIAATVQ